MTDQRADEAETRADTAEVRADQAEVRADDAEHRADDAEVRQDASDVRQDVRVVDIDKRLEALGDRLDEAKKAVDEDREHRVAENVLRDRRIRWSRRSTVLALVVAALALWVGRDAAATSDEVCSASQKNRDVLVQLVSLNGDGFDPEAVPGFDALTPELQTYLKNLAAQDVDGGSFKDQALVLLSGDPCS